jgi:hypothetical protein
MTLDFVKKFFTEDMLRDTVKRVTMCGDVGDPIYCKEYIEICRYIKNDEKENKIDEFFKLLVKNNLTNVFLNNYDYENFRIGFIVKNYEKFLEKEKNDVDKFCKKYILKKPTFFGALVGELE